MPQSTQYFENSRNLPNQISDAAYDRERLILYRFGNLVRPTDSTKITYVCTKRIFDSRLIMYRVSNEFVDDYV